MSISRRKIIKAAGLGGLLLAADGLVRPAGAGAATGTGTGVVDLAVRARDLTGAMDVANSVDLAAINPTRAGAPGLTTLAQTLSVGPDVGGGYRKIVAAPGEGRVIRADIGGVAYLPTFSFGAFAQLSDLQIVDDRSPARIEFLDRYADGNWPTGSAYRPQETLSTHLTDALARRVRQIGYGPRLGDRLGFAIVTGDAIDNVQWNETRWYIDLLDGGRTITTASGDVEMSVTSGWNFFFPDVNVDHYWYAMAIPDLTTVYDRAGFPYFTNYLQSARRPYQTTGLGLPWYIAYGNHDGLWQGNLAPRVGWQLNLRERAVGNSKMVDTDPLPADFDDMGLGDAFTLLLGTKSVSSGNGTNDRRLLTRAQFIEEHFLGTSNPPGHGFTRGSDKAYYVIPTRPEDLITYITLDTVNYFGADVPHSMDGAAGSIDERQLNWLETQLRANSSRYLVSDVLPPERRHNQGNDEEWRIPGRGLRDGATSHWVNNPGVKDRLIVVFAHHTIGSMDNLNIPSSGMTVNDVRWTGDALRRLLLAYPNVIAMVNGHTHANRIDSHFRGNQAPIDGGFWEISSAAHIDWPVQSRLIEIGSAGGVVSIFTTVIDADAPLDHGGDLSTPEKLASLGREIAANDPQERAGLVPPLLFPGTFNGDHTRRGRLLDRNTQLLVPAPFPLPDPWRDGVPAAIGVTGTVGDAMQMDLYITNFADLMFSGDLKGPRGGGMMAWSRSHDSQTIRSVAVATNQNGLAEIFGVGPDTYIYRRMQTATNSWTGSTWQRIDGQLTTITAARYGDGKLEIIGTNGVGNVFRRRQVSVNTWAGSVWEMLDGPLLTQVTATGRKDGKLALFALRRDGRVFQRIQTTAGVWAGTTWTELPLFAQSIAATTSAARDTELFGVGVDGEILRMIQQQVGTTLSITWAPLTANGAQYNIKSLAVAQEPLQGLVLVGVDADGGAYVRNNGGLIDDSAWTNWRKIGSGIRPTTLPTGLPVATAPATQMSAPGTVVNFQMPAPSGGTAPYYWYFSGLPAGLSGSLNGHVSGVVTESPGASRMVSATVLDDRHLATSVTFRWRIGGGTMPNVIRMFEDEAVAAVQALGVNPTIRRVPSPTRANWDRCTAQSPTAGTQVTVGQTVTLTIAIELEL